jgi:hypothetical protein
MGKRNWRGKMKKIVWIFIVMVLWLIMGVPMHAYAVSYSVVEEQRDEKIAKGIMKVGDAVCLFQSGTPDVKKAIAIGDILVVYREGSKHELKEVGKIKVLSYSGEDYLKGEVIEGEIKAGDVAKKGNVASLIISSGDKCN